MTIKEDIKHEIKFFVASKIHEFLENSTELVSCEDIVLYFSNLVSPHILELAIKHLEDTVQIDSHGDPLFPLGSKKCVLVPLQSDIPF